MKTIGVKAIQICLKWKNGHEAMFDRNAKIT